jgi:hypothetical protein
MAPQEHLEPAINESADAGADKISRDAAQITFARIADYQKLWAETQQAGDELFLEQTRELWKDLAVSGIASLDRNHKVVVQNATDLDGRASIGLMHEAGVDTTHVKYVASGDYEKGAINMDTGNQEGLVVEDSGATAFMDHHAKDSKNDTSSAAIVYETLASIGLLHRTEAMDALVEFVTHVDNRTYPGEENQFLESWHTVLGLSRYITFPKLLEYFKAGHNPTEKLSTEDLESLGLAAASKKQKEIISQSGNRIKEMSKEGLVVPTLKHGLAVVDIGKTIKGGFEAIKAFRCGCYIIWSPESQSFFISTTTPLQEEFPQGRKVRESMWIKARHDKEPLRVKLEEVLKILGVKEAAMAGKLKDFLQDEERGVLLRKTG